jgi:DNA-binding MarR family transcriptional regulator
MKLTTFPPLAVHLRGFSEYLQRVGAELFREAFRVHGLPSLSIQQLAYLEVIEGGSGVTPGQLAARFGVRKPTVTSIVARLEHAGLVSREQSASDRRAFLLRPTRTARAVFQRRRGMYAKLAAHITGRLEAAEVGELVRLMDKIAVGSLAEGGAPHARA